MHGSFDACGWAGLTWIKLSLQSAIAALILASASLVEAQIFQTLYSFTGGSDGGLPQTALTLGNDGNFYGTTQNGGSGSPPNYDNLDGTVFRLTTNGTLTTLYSFTGRADGAFPEAALTLGSDGNFYGTTYTDGNSGPPFYDKLSGTVFRLTPNGMFTVLYSFTGGSDGGLPEAALTLGNDGNFYGTTAEGGLTGSLYSHGMGTLFKVTTNGTLTTLYSFTGGADGADPRGALTLGNDGNFYGTTAGGGLTSPYFYYGMGTVFRVTTNGTLSTLASFSGANGAYPYAALKLGSDGNFYGTTSLGGNTSLNGDQGWGTVFKVTANGTLTTLFAFNYGNGACPQAALTLGSDGNFYGTTVEGGLTASGYPYGPGTVFRLLAPIAPPSITAQPLCCQAPLGSGASFSVSVNGTPPFHYQWRFNGGSILNATNAAYVIQAVGATNTGNYSVVVTNSAGSVTSSNAVLTVIVPPTLGLQLSAGCPLLNLNGMLSSNFVVQYSANVAGTNWINLLSMSNFPASPYSFYDSNGFGKPARFYRAFMH